MRPCVFLWLLPIFLAGCVMAQTAPATSASAGSITGVVPRVTVFRQKTSGAANLKNASGEVAVKDMSVGWGDIIRTETSGRARIHLHDGSLLSLGSNSTLRVVKHDSRSQQTALELGYGRIRCQVASLTRDGKFELRTPTAVAGVIGTDFGADSSQPDSTQFICVK